MSKYMQLTVKVRAYYPESIKAVYPKIVGHLSHANAAMVDEDPSIFDLVGSIDKLLYALDGDPAFQEILRKHKPTLETLHQEIQGRIADWELAKADQALYRLEDAFEQIEWELDKA